MEETYKILNSMDVYTYIHIYVTANQRVIGLARNMTNVNY